MANWLAGLLAPDLDARASLQGVEPQRRPQAIERALRELAERAAQRFPPQDGYTVRVADELARWPRGAESEKEARKLIGPEEAALAPSRRVVVRRGLTWGLTLQLQPADRAQGALVLHGHIESRLATALAVFGMLGCGLGAIVVGLAANDWKWPRGLLLAGLLGMLVGVPVGLGLGALAKVIGNALGTALPREEGRRHFEELSEAVRAASARP